MPELILLLGGSGYIGTHLLLEFHGMNFEDNDEFQVAIIDKNPPHEEAVKFVEKNSKHKVLHWIQDLEDKNVHKWPILPKVPYCAIMLAAKKSVLEAESYREDYLRTNINISLNCMQYLANNGVERLIQGSSSTVYYTTDDGVPVGTYGMSKKICEDICVRLLHEDQSLAVLRYMNPVGSHREVKCFSDIGLCAVLSKLKPESIFYNRGNCYRDYIHITDLASFHSHFLKSWSRIFSEEKNRVIYTDIGTGKTTSVEELCQIFSKIIPECRIEETVFLPKYACESPVVCGAIFKAGDDYWKWKCKVSLEEAIKDYKTFSF